MIINGSWLMAHDSWLMTHVSWLMPHGQESALAPDPRPSLGHEVSAMSLDPLTIDSLINKLLLICLLGSRWQATNSLREFGPFYGGSHVEGEPLTFG